MVRNSPPPPPGWPNALAGLLDNNRDVIQSIDVNYDFDYLMSQFKHGDARKLLEIKELMATLPRASTVSVTSASDLAKELLTHSLSGTLITNKERLNKFKSLTEVDESRLLVLLEQAFGAPMVPNYLDMIRDDIHSVYVSENYLACSIVTNQVGLPYLSKFAVSQTAQMEGLGKRLWEDMAKDIPNMMWRSRTVNVRIPCYPLLDPFWQVADDVTADQQVVLPAFHWLSYRGRLDRVLVRNSKLCRCP